LPLNTTLQAHHARDYRRVALDAGTALEHLLKACLAARVHVHPRLLDDLVPSALHTVEQYANNPIEADHGRLKARLRPMRGLKRHRSARILAAGHAFVRNLRRGHYDIATDVPGHHRLRKAFDGLAITIRSAAHSSDHALTVYRMAQRNSASA